MSEITLALEHPSLGCGEIIARYDLTEIQEKAYQQGRADAIEEYRILLKEEWLQLDDDLSLSDDFYNFVDKIAEQVKTLQ